MATKKKIAKDAQEWYQMARQDWSKWNSKAHAEDVISWVDYLGELVGSVIYGYRVVMDDYSSNGYSVRRAVL
jgi:hypothetical protein